MRLTKMAHSIWLSIHEKSFFPKNLILILILYRKLSKKSQNWLILGRFADNRICLKLPALWGLKYMIGNFFHNMDPPVNLDIVQEIAETFEIRLNWSDWQTPPFVQNGQHCGAPNT